MFSTIDLLFTLADLALALCYAKLAIEDLFCTMANPTWRSERLFLDDFLDDGLDRRMHDLGGGCERTDYRRRGNAAGSTDEKLSFATSDLCLTHGDGRLTSDECLGTLGGEETHYTA